MRERQARPILSTIVSSSAAVPTISTGEGPLRELSLRATNSALNSREPSPSQRLFPNANALPATISKELKPQNKSDITVPKRAYVENAAA
jgi:hypothetical protein